MQTRIRREFEPFSDRTIEAFVCGDLDDADVALIEEAMASRPELRAHIQERRAEQAAFPLANRPPVFAETKDGRTGRGWQLRRKLAVAGAALAALFIGFVMVPGSSTENVPAVSEVRAKGALQTAWTVRRGKRVFSYTDGVLLRAGDALRLSLHARDPGYLTVLGRDPTGFSVHYDNLAVPRGDFTAPGSLVLDGARYDETWYVLLAPKPLQTKEVTEALRRERPVAAALATLAIRRDPEP